MILVLIKLRMVIIGHQHIDLQLKRGSYIMNQPGFLCMTTLDVGG